MDFNMYANHNTQCFPSSYATTQFYNDTPAFYDNTTTFYNYNPYLQPTYVQPTPFYGYIQPQFQLPVSTSKPGPARLSKGPEILERIQKATATAAALNPEDDVVFVSLDFEFFHIGGIIPSITQFGFEWLDARKFNRQTHDVKELRQFWVRDNSANGGLGKRYNEAQSHLEGVIQSHGLTKAELATIIRAALQPRDETSPLDKPARKVILVGHQLDSDIELINSTGFDWSSCPNVMGYIDTIDLARDVLGFSRTPKLMHLLSHCQVPYDSARLHIAAFDAHYTMQAILSIAQDYTPELKIQQQQTLQYQKKFPALQFAQSIKTPTIPPVVPLKVLSPREQAMQELAKLKATESALRNDINTLPTLAVPV